MEIRKSFASTRGFTLIELMIAVAILAIIMGIAIPSYTQYVLKSGRADAKGGLMEAAQMLERCYTRNSTYVGCSGATNYPKDTENGKYNISIAEATPTSFDLLATALTSQANDTECGNFTLDHTGKKGVSAGTEPALIDKCW